jgi:hypothetical protein
MTAAPSNTPPEIDLSDLESLRPAALAALAERMVWRTAPAMVNEAIEVVVVRDLMLSSLSWVSARAPRERLEPLVENTLLEIMQHPPTENEPGSMRALDYISDAASVSIDPEQYRTNLKMLMAPLEDSQERIAFVDDFLWLSEWQQQKRSMDGIVAADFFERPLWAGTADGHPPPVWGELIERWLGRLDETEDKRFSELYRRMLSGGGLDWGLLDEWLKGALVDESAEAPPPPAEDEATPTTEELLQGGIVTAAADKPATEDHLGREPLVNTLADMLSSPEQSLPMTIALLGDWGAGKSSVLEQLKLRLEKLKHKKDRARYLFADFNAWEYEQTENLRAGLAQEVVRGLVKGLSKNQQLSLALRNAARNHGMSFYLSVAWLLAVALGALLGIFNLEKLSELNAITQSVIGTGGVAVVLFTLARTGQRLLKLLEHPLAEKLSTYLRLPSYGEHLGLVPVIRKEVSNLCEARLNMGDADRLLVIVDDLDRCHPSAITETLDAIRLVMNLDKVAVIIAIDDRIAFRAVAEHYKDLAEPKVRSKEEIARDYLSKIIQLPVNLYAPWPNEVETFISDALFKLVTETQNEAPPPETASQASGNRQPQTMQTSSSAEARKAEVKAAETDAPSTETPLRQSTSTPLEPPAEETGDGLLPDTVFERDLFVELTHEFGFHNPRKLIRLRNSYRWLKGYRHSSRAHQLKHSLARELMLGLFWYEYLYQRKLHERQFAELTLWLWPANVDPWEKWAEEKLKSGQFVPVPVRAARRFSEMFGMGEYASAYSQLMKTVELVVLPNAEMGLIESLDQAHRVLGKNTDGSLRDLDPWAQPSRA